VRHEFFFTAALLAAGLGALRALEPSHGKTIAAEYLAGSGVTARLTLRLGWIASLAPAAGVYLLGALTLYASRYILPDRLFPWLDMLSGTVITLVACLLLVRAWAGEAGEHRHDGGPSHSLGIFGRIVPCPGALVVLLSALSLHSVGLGLLLIVAYSLGLAAMLIATGSTTLYRMQLHARWSAGAPLVKRWLPLASAAVMLVLGLCVTGRALLETAAANNLFAHGALPSFLGVVLLGLFLGMRHSTDPDHVIAVSTIASRERSVAHGALIGVLWGVGHTLTIFLVGSAIILFGLVIPARLGLAMEFSVALMLILLGILNLTGALRWLNDRLSPTSPGTPSPGESPGSSNAANPPATLLDKLLGRYGSYQVFRPLVIGLVHGLAGSAAVALLVLSTIHTPIWAIAYLLVFGVGTIIGMMLMTSAMAIPVVYTGKRFAAANRYLTPLSGIVSTAFGLVLLYQIGCVDGLFRANPHWIPQ
jgi:high-affinity nickel-transport protein